MQDIGLIIELAIMVLAIGAIAGVIAGLLGVGGGLILVPAFHFAFSKLGYESPYLMQICLATSLATIIVTSARSVSSHAKKNAVDWEILKHWAPGIAVGAIIGVVTASSLRSATLQAIFGVLAIIIGLFFAFGHPQWRLSDNMPKGILRAIISPIVGFLSVLMGIGGGSFGVPVMTLFGSPFHRAVATAAGFGALIAVPSVAAFLLVSIPAEAQPPFTIGAVNIPSFLAVIAMTLITAPIGVRLAHAAEPKILRRFFAVFILAVAISMLRKAYLGL